MEGKSINLRGLSVFYQTAGSGPVVLILHGWGGSSASWSKVQEALASEGFNTVCPDLPGFGRTKAPDETWSLDDYARFVLEFADSLSLDDFFLVGHSFGGRISIKLSSIKPERIKKMILCGSAGLKMEKDLKARIVSNCVSFAKHSPFLKKLLKKPLYLFLGNRDYVKADEQMKKIMAFVISEDLEPLLPLISQETLLVWGDKDKLVPLKYADVFKKKIKNSRLEVVKGAGHALNLERPSVLADKISSFLKK
jgi:pimeloyl-ACP methyl ester carboxylesterase